jgi:aromatic-amino-acid transaminase
MNSPTTAQHVSPSLFANVELAPRDPIIGITEAYNADPNPNKVNLGVGVYVDDDGKVPVLECVRRAEEQLAANGAPSNYLPIEGLKTYAQAAQELLFSPGHSAVKQGRIVTVQAVGGTGAIKLGADFLRRLLPQAGVYISDPSWENHRAIFEFAGFRVQTYPYYDPETHGVKFEAMIQALQAMPEGSIVVLHGCCHNPTGVDLSAAQWTKVIETVRSRALVPYVDIAYQGFGDGLDTDAQAARRFADECPNVLVASSFSKSLSLYGERAGALSVVTADATEVPRVLSQVKRVIRTNYSNPPSHGSQTAAMVLTKPELRALWEQELGGMRDRIKLMRRQLVEKIRSHRADFDFSFVIEQRGMFSYSGLTAQQVERLRAEYGIYAVSSGRICIAALNSRNIDYVAKAIACVLV